MTTEETARRYAVRVPFHAPITDDGARKIAIGQMNDAIRRNGIHASGPVEVHLEQPLPGFEDGGPVVTAVAVVEIVPEP